MLAIAPLKAVSFYLLSTLIPLVTANGYVAKTLNSSFDDITTDPLGTAGTVPTPYDDLVFSIKVYNSGLSVLRANSAPNYLSSSQLDRDLSGLPPANFSSRYTGSKVKFFTLISSYVACSIKSTSSVPPVVQPGTTPAIRVPQPCTLLFEGFTVGGQNVNQTCSYSGTPTEPAMQLCYFSEAFWDVVTVTIAVLNSATLPDTTTLVLDNIVHTNYY